MQHMCISMSLLSYSHGMGKHHVELNDVYGSALTTLCFVCGLELACVEGEWILAPEQAPKALATSAPPAKPPANAKAPLKGMDPPPPPLEGNLGFLKHHFTS